MGRRTFVDRIGADELRAEALTPDATVHVLAAAAGVRCCRECGCTDMAACPGGCYWVEPDLCSRCAR